MAFLVKVVYSNSYMVASHDNKRVFVPFDYSLNTDERKLEAVQTFCKKFGYKIVTNEVVTHTTGKNTESFVLCSK